ncbi:MAG: YihY family inner membrane protein [Proteobacteria bacterium]|nr:YihY family inner membrane protein [Pseudomonadota bacterium]
MSTEPVAQSWLKQGRAFLAYAWKRFVDDRCLGIAATLSYTSLLALVPLAAIAFAVLAVFPVFEGVREEIQAFVFKNFMPDTGERLADTFDGFVNNAGGLTTVGIAGLVVTAVMLLATIGSTLNTIFRVPRPRRLVARLLVYLAVLTLGPLVVGASILLATNIPAMAGFDAFTRPLGRLGGVVPALIAVAAFTLLYAVVPNRTVAWRNAIAGGVAAGILFSILRWAFGMYLVYFPEYRTIYGALSTVPIFLVWMYLSWAVILFGAVLTASLADWRGGGPADRG